MHQSMPLFRIFSLFLSHCCGKHNPFIISECFGPVLCCLMNIISGDLNYPAAPLRFKVIASIRICEFNTLILLQTFYVYERHFYNDLC